MSRSSQPYARYGDRVFEGYSPDTPIAGYYRFRMRSGAAHCGIRIWFGPPLDPETGEEMDRGHRWQAAVNGSYVELERVWPACARSPIDEAEYRHLSAMHDWARNNAPDSAFADLSKPVDLMTAPILI